MSIIDTWTRIISLYLLAISNKFTTCVNLYLELSKIATIFYTTPRLSKHIALCFNVTRLATRLKYMCSAEKMISEKMMLKHLYGNV